MSPENSLESKHNHHSQWWHDLPPDTPVRVIVQGRVNDLENLPENPSLRKEKLRLLYRDAVQKVRDYISENSENFNEEEIEMISEYRGLGMLALTLKPPQCDLLMDSGNVSAIFPDTIIKIGSRKLF